MIFFCHWTKEYYPYNVSSFVIVFATDFVIMMEMFSNVLNDNVMVLLIHWGINA